MVLYLIHYDTLLQNVTDILLQNICVRGVLLHTATNKSVQLNVSIF